MFADIDAVCTEDDLFNRAGMGRVHRSWVKARQAFEPEFKDPKKPERKRLA